MSQANQRLPPPDFDRAMLDLKTTWLDDFLRLYNASYPDPLGYGKARNRFADPQLCPANERFGVVYLGQTLKGCFVEAVLRDRANATIGDFVLAENELYALNVARISTQSPLHLVDLRCDGAVCMRVPTDAIRGSDHELGMAWSLAFYRHPQQPDGIIYHSRLNESLNIAVYDRAVRKLVVCSVTPIMDEAGLAAILSTLGVKTVKH